MKNIPIYIRRQAFNNAHEEHEKSSGKPSGGFDRPKKYHHAPEKLKDFTSYVDYSHWSNELYSASIKLIGLLRKIYDRAKETKSAWYNNKSDLDDILDEYDQLKPSLNDLYDDISEFQICMLATDISEKQAEIEALSDQVRQLGTLENKIIETCNRKLYEIGSSRTTLAVLTVSIISLFISLKNEFGLLVLTVFELWNFSFQNLLQ